MQKVLGNLLSNAIKFTPNQGMITVIASTYIDKSDHKERLYVAVKDTGKGILEEDMVKIFDRFYQSKQNQALSGYGQSGTGIDFICVNELFNCITVKLRREISHLVVLVSDSLSN